VSSIVCREVCQCIGEKQKGNGAPEGPVRLFT
jgi:hypothetical protein